MNTFHRVLLLILVVAGLPVQAAVNRTLSIQAPAKAAPGSAVSVIVSSSTDAGDGEEIGFLHAEYSIDEGKTWTPFGQAAKSGKEHSIRVSFAVDALGGNAIVRARAAFRKGGAGDVDYKGSAIQWDETWQKWRWPPAKYAIIQVPKVAAVKRTMGIEAPVEGVLGSKVSVTVYAETDARDGEEIGFLHAEYSLDEGKTWTQFCYAEKSGAKLSRQVVFPLKPSGRKAIVRLRVAFRGGVAGDVDYRGSDIQWDDSWQKWRSPAAKYAIIFLSKS